MGERKCIILGDSVFLSFYFPFLFLGFFYQAKVMKAEAGVLLWAFDLCLLLHLEARLGKWMGNSRELSTKMQISE